MWRVLEAKVISGYASYGPNLLTVPHAWVRMWVFSCPNSGIALCSLGGPLSGHMYPMPEAKAKGVRKNRTELSRGSQRIAVGPGRGFARVTPWCPLTLRSRLTGLSGGPLCFHLYLRSSWHRVGTDIRLTPHGLPLVEQTGQREEVRPSCRSGEYTEGVMSLSCLGFWNLPVDDGRRLGLPLLLQMT